MEIPERTRTLIEQIIARHEEDYARIEARLKKFAAGMAAMEAERAQIIEDERMIAGRIRHEGLELERELAPIQEKEQLTEAVTADLEARGIR